MPDPARKLATYDDLLAVPEEFVAEILNGELIAMPRPALRHAKASSSLGMDLGGPFQRGRGGPGGWLILDEPELHLGADVLVPDLAGWRRDRAPDLAAPWTDQVPDWLCEVLSDATRGLDRVRKLPIYARAGVGHVWLVDPAARTLEVFRKHERAWLLVATFGGSDLVRAEPFDAIELDLGGLWDPIE